MTRPIVSTRPLLAILALLIPLTGCYYYAPVDRPTRSDPTQIVRARFPQAQDMEMSNDVVVQSVVRVEGRPLDWRADTLLLRATAFHQTGNRSVTPPAGQTLWIPRDRMTVFEERRLDAKRTSLLVGGVALGGAGLAFLLFGDEAGGNERQPLDPDSDSKEARGLRFVVPFPFGGGP